MTAADTASLKSLKEKDITFSDRNPAGSDTFLPDPENRRKPAASVYCKHKFYTGEPLEVFRTVAGGQAIARFPSNGAIVLAVRADDKTKLQVLQLHIHRNSAGE